MFARVRAAGARAVSATLALPCCRDIVAWLNVTGLLTSLPVAGNMGFCEVLFLRCACALEGVLGRCGLVEGNAVTKLSVANSFTR